MKNKKVVSPPAGGENVQTDAMLVKLAEEGSNKAFDTLMLRRQTHVQHFLHVLLHDSEMEHDAAQDVWLSLLQDIRSHRYKEQESFIEFLNTITFREALKARRRKKFFVEGEQPEQRSATNIEEEYITKERRSMVQSELGKMDPHAAAIYRMKVLEDLEYKEIAAALEMTVGGASSSLCKTVAKLKKRFLPPSKGGL